jgi:putative holliday junction resolvase
VGVDLGERRIGVAVSDGTGTLAWPRCTIERSGDDDADRGALIAVVEEVGARHVVVGLPVSLDGRPRAAARRAQAEADALAQALAPRGISVETFDERFTTVSAARSLAEAGRPSRRQRAVIDQAAATVLLQAWLDARRAGAAPPVDDDPTTMRDDDHA